MWLFSHEAGGEPCGALESSCLSFVLEGLSATVSCASRRFPVGRCNLEPWYTSRYAMSLLRPAWFGGMARVAVLGAVVAYVAGAIEPSEWLENSRSVSAQLDSAWACRLAKEHFKDFTCGRLTQHGRLAQLDNTYGNTTMCFALIHRWFVVDFVTKEPCPTTPPPLLVGHPSRAEWLKAETDAKQAVFHAKWEAERLARRAALVEAARSVAPVPHRETRCSAPLRGKGALNVPFAERELFELAPGAGSAGKYLASGELDLLFFKREVAPLPRREPDLLAVLDPDADGYVAPSGREGGFRGWLRLVNVTTGVVECETRLEVDGAKTADPLSVLGTNKKFARTDVLRIASFRIAFQDAANAALESVGATVKVAEW